MNSVMTHMGYCAYPMCFIKCIQSSKELGNGDKMFKNLLMSVLFTGLSITSISVFAGSIESQHAIANVVSVAHSPQNEAGLLQVNNKSAEDAISVTSQPQFESAENNESTLSTGWLLAVALLWFVILSNRRGV